MSKIAVMKKNGKYYLKNKPVPVYWKDVTTEVVHSNITSANGWTATSSTTFDGYTFFQGGGLGTGSTSRPLPTFTLKIPENHKGVTIKSMSLQISGQGDGVNVYDLYKNDTLIQRVTFTVQQSVVETKDLSEPIVLTPDDTLKVVCISYAYNSGYWTSFWAKLNMDEIRAIKLIPIKEDSTTKYECSYYTAWTQPVLTSDATSTSLGTIYTSASSWYNDNTRPYKIMTGSTSSTVDVGYWQINNNTSAQWLLIQFPYKLKIRYLSVVTRPRDNYARTFSVYTDSNKTQKIGNTVSTSAALTIYTIADGGEYITDKLYFAVNSGGDGWWGIQDLQIRADRLIEETIDNYDYTTERNTYNAWLKG